MSSRAKEESYIKRKREGERGRERGRGGEGERDRGLGRLDFMKVNVATEA